MSASEDSTSPSRPSDQGRSGQGTSDHNDAEVDILNAPWKDVIAAMRSNFSAQVRTVVQSAFDLHRELFAFCLRGAPASGPGPVASDATARSGSDEGWSEIASLSQLRAVVGGRFQNLKDRWVQSGFPLKEHRGDKSLEYSLKDVGWLELSSWISKQGFEVRLRPDKEKCLFEIRKR